MTDGLASAVQQARAVAGGKDVAIAGGGSIVRQALAAGLVDELELHVSPVVLGEGLRLLDAGLGLGGRPPLPRRAGHPGSREMTAVEPAAPFRVQNGRPGG